MAQDAIRERLCEWDPVQNRRKREGDILLHLAIARFIISETPDDRIELCEKCADLPRFKNAVRHWIPDKT